MSAPARDTVDDLPRDLYANDPARDLDERRNIKLKIPLRQHIRLHALRLYSGQSASHAVETALDLYFERVRAEAKGPAPTATGLPDAAANEVA